MRILSVGLSGIPSATNHDLISADVFQDYEALVVNPSSLHTLYGAYTESIFATKQDDSTTNSFTSFAKNVNAARRDQVKGLMNKNGALICLLHPIMRWRAADAKRTISNYEWLFTDSEIFQQFNNIIYGTGTTIDYISPNHPFTEYLSTKPRWSAYIQRDACDQTKWNTLATAFGTHLLSIASTTETGHIIFLPSEYNTQNGELLEQCIRKLLGDKDITPTPEWAISISVPGQDKIRKQLEEIDAQVDAIKQKRSTLVSQNTALESWKWLLYETGKYRLEPIVHKALSLLNCKVEPQPDSESDGKVETEFGIALLEIEGATETIKIDKISQLLRNIANFVYQQNIPVKGVLVGNPFRCDELSNRPPKGSQKRMFSDQLLRTAEMNNISVLLSTDLYEIVCLILDHKLTTQQIKSLRERIFQGKGLITLSVT